MRNLVNDGLWRQAVDPDRQPKNTRLAPRNPSTHHGSFPARANEATAFAASSPEVRSMPEPVKISRRSLHDELAQLIRAMIVGGELRPGQRINEQALCVRFLVSRTPLREALKVLSAERLVRLLPNRGAVVVSITHKEADDLMSILGVLEAFAIELGCARLDDSEIAAGRARYEEMTNGLHGDEKPSYAALDRGIFAALLKASGNTALIDVYRLLEARLMSVLSCAPIAEPPSHEVVAAHRRLMEALEARDGPALVHAAREQMRRKAEIVHEALNAFGVRA